MKRDFARLGISPILLIIVLIFQGCDSSSGVSSGGDSGYEMTMQLGSNLLEGGGITELSMSLKDAFGMKLHDQSIQFILYEEPLGFPTVGVLNVAVAATDTNAAHGLTPPVSFQTQGLGTAIIKAVYNDVAGNRLDSAEVEIDVVISLHSLTLTLFPGDSIATGETTQISSIIFEGSQETAVRVAGKTIRFLATDQNSPLDLFGVVEPEDFGISNTDQPDGLDGDYTFQSNIPGYALIKAIYYNGLGQVADSAVATIRVYPFEP